MQKAAKFLEYSVAGVSVEENVSVPSASEIPPDCLLVEVHASSINPIDYKIVNGYLQKLPGLPRPPSVVGQDFAGVVKAIGSKCKRIEVEDKVFGFTASPYYGTFQEYAIIPEKCCGLLPSNASFSEAAAIATVGITCIMALGDLETRNKMAEKTVLIIGASGGTGSIGIQWASKSLHMKKVIGVCSAKNVEYVRNLGAHEVLDYTDDTPWYEKIPDQSVDLVYDCVGGADLWNHCQRILKRGGDFVTIVGPDLKKEDMTLFSMTKYAIGTVFWSKIKSYFGSPNYTFFLADSKRFDLLQQLSKEFESGNISMQIHQEFPFTTSGVRDLISQGMTKRTVGKAVLKIK